MKQRKNDEIPVSPKRSFADLIGFEEVVSRFTELMHRDRLPQVLLFEGRPALGKRKLLARLIAGLYCEGKNACGQCQPCHAVIHGYQADLLWVEKEGPIRVADADMIQEHLNYQARGAQRVVAIVDIETMNDQAANRLLKTLEEPPPRTLILLSCSRPRQLLATISSRLVRWPVKPPALAMSQRWLQATAAAEIGLQISDEEAREALEQNGLAPGRALTALKAADSDEKAAQHRLAALLLKPLEARNLQELQDLIKQRAWKANELAQHFELLLNRYYKWSLGLTAERPAYWPASLDRSDPRLLRQRRRILQQIYRGSGQGYNVLNTQLAAEALGFDPQAQ